MTEQQVFQDLGWGWCVNSCTIQSQFFTGANWFKGDPDGNIPEQLARYGNLVVHGRNMEEVRKLHHTYGDKLAGLVLRNEPDQKNQDYLKPAEYVACVRELAREGIRVWGPNACDPVSEGWIDEWFYLGGAADVKVFILHAYSGTATPARPEDLPAFVLRMEARARRRLVIGEFGPGATLTQSQLADWFFKGRKIAKQLARPIAGYRLPNADGTGFVNDAGGNFSQGANSEAMIRLLQLESGLLNVGPGTN